MHGNNTAWRLCVVLRPATNVSFGRFQRLVNVQLRFRGLVGCTKCGSSYHPLSHVRANPFLETLPL